MDRSIVLPRQGRRWIGSFFGTVPAGAWRHSPSDGVRVAAGILVLGLSSLAVTDLSGLDKWLLDVVAPIPSALDGVLSLLGWIGGLVPPVIVLGAALVGRRGRLVLAMVAAMASTAAIAVLLRLVVDPVSGASIASAGIPWPGGDPSFPELRLALAASVVFAAAPFLTRPSRRLVVGGLVLAAACQLALVAQLPVALLAGFILGWTVAAAVHLVLGSPAGVPMPSDVAQALTALGMDGATVGEGHDRSFGVRAFSARTRDGDELAVTVLGHEAAQFGAFHSVVRRLWFKDAGRLPTVSSRAAAEHQALLLLLAEREGVVVPSLVAAGIAGNLPDPMVVVRASSAPTLVDLGQTLDPATVPSLWVCLGALHDSGIVHGDLRADAMAVAADGTVGFTDLSSATARRSPAQVVMDRAQLLVTTAALVGEGPAIAACGQVVGTSAIEDIVPVLQPAAFTSEFRRSVPDARHLLSRLRGEVAAAAGVDEPELVQLRRVAPASLLMGVGALLGAYLLVGELTSINGLWSMLSDASVGWVVAVALLSQTPQLAQAVGMIGSVMAPIPMGPATAVQFANQFMGLVGGTIATTALVIRFFQRMGLAAAVAVSSGVLNTLAAMATQVVLVAIAVVATRGDWTLPTRSGGDGSSGGRALVAALVVGVAVLVGVLLTVPKFRRSLLDKLGPQVTAARQNLHEVRGQPRKVLELFGGAMASQVLFALTLSAAVSAYGGSVPLLQLIVVNCFASLLGGIAPVPGGMGVIEAGLIVGLVAAGVPQDVATAATFTHRLFTAYLPPTWGWFALRWLRRHSYV